MATREIKTIFAIDGQQKYRDAIKGINDQQKTLNVQMKASAAQYDLTGDKQNGLRSKIEGLNKQIDLQRKKVAEARAAMEKATQKYGENSDTTQELTRDYYAAELGLAKLQKQLITTNKDLTLQESKLRKAGEAAQAAGQKMQKIGDGMTRVGSAMTVAVTAPILAAAGASAKAAMEFESAFAGVVKTVNGTEEQLAKLQTGIREMSKEVPTAATNIAGVAEAAGQLGIQTDNILGFTRVMVDLGEATNLSATEGASQLAKFANITQMSQKDFDRLGSSIVALGNASATTEADIVAMSMRLAGAGKQVGMSEADILGLAAALSSVGIEAEAGGSAMSKVMVEMQLAVLKGGTALDKFASTAGMSAAQFAQAYETDAAGAITAFVTGLGNLEKQGGSAIATLDGMGITEVRMRDALLRAAGAGDLMTKSIKLSNGAWEDNNALTKEAAQRYATTESQLKISKNRITDSAITIGKQLLPVIADLVGDIAKAAEAFGKMDPAMQKATLGALAIAAAIGPVVGTLGSVTKGVGSLTEAWGKFAVKAAEKGATSAMTAGLTGASGAASGLAATLGPLAIVVGTVAVAMAIDYNTAAAQAARETKRLREEVAQSTAAFKSTTDETRRNASSAEDLASQLFALSGKEKLSNAEKAKMAGMVSQLNQLYPELNLQIDQQTGKLNQSEEAVRDLIKALRDQLLLKSEIERSLEIDRQEAELLKRKQDAQSRLMVDADALQAKWGPMARGYANLDRAKVELDGINESLNNLASDKREVDEAINEIADSVVNANKDMADSSEDLAEGGKMRQEDLAKSNAKTTEAYAEEMRKRLELSEEFQKELENKTQEHLDQMGGIEDKGIKKTKQTAAQVKRNLEKQIKDFQEWRREIKNLSSRVPEDVMTELQALGPGAEPIIEDLNKMSDEKLNAFVETWRKKGELASEAALDGMRGTPAQAATIGAQTGQGFADGLDSKTSAVAAEARSLAYAATVAMRKELGVASPSKVMLEIGKFTGEGLELGLAKSKDAVINEASALAAGIIGAVSGLDGTEASIRARVDASGLPSKIGAASLATTSAMAAGRSAAAVAAAPSTGMLVIAGEITVRGVNDKNQTMDVVRIIKNELQQELLLAGRK